VGRLGPDESEIVQLHTASTLGYRVAPRDAPDTRRATVRHVSLLAPSGTGPDLATAGRIAVALEKATSLVAAAVEPNCLQFTSSAPLVHQSPGDAGSKWRTVVPSFLACLGVASKHVSGARDITSNRNVYDDSLDECGKSLRRWEERVLRRAGLLGVPVNLDYGLCSFGRKDVLERRCRYYEEQTGSVLPRPRTWIVPSGPVQRFLGYLPPGDIGRVIVKPVNGTCAMGIEILTSVKDLAAAQERRVVQELVASPLRIRDHKVDARAYIVLSGVRELRCSVPRLVIIRRAIRRYAEGKEQAEVCSLAYARRLGSPVSAMTLAQLEAKGEPEVNGVRQAIETTMTQLKGLLAFFKPEVPFFGVWGVDLALRTGSEGVEALLIELNPEPVLYRGINTLDVATDEMLATDVGPRLEKFLSTASAR